MVKIGENIKKKDIEELTFRNKMIERLYCCIGMSLYCLDQAQAKHPLMETDKNDPDKEVENLYWFSKDALLFYKYIWTCATQGLEEWYDLEREDMNIRDMAGSEDEDDDWRW